MPPGKRIVVASFDRNGTLNLMTGCYDLFLIPRIRFVRF
jgi:hypothetical protein